MNENQLAARMQQRKRASTLVSKASGGKPFAEDNNDLVKPLRQQSSIGDLPLKPAGKGS